MEQTIEEQCAIELKYLREEVVGGESLVMWDTYSKNDKNIFTTAVVGTKINTTHFHMYADTHTDEKVDTLEVAQWLINRGMRGVCESHILSSKRAANRFNKAMEDADLLIPFKPLDVYLLYYPDSVVNEIGGITREQTVDAITSLYTGVKLIKDKA